MSGIIAGATLGAGALGYLGAKKAGDAASTAASDQAAVTKQMYDQSREDLQPFLQAATGTLDTRMKWNPATGKFENSYSGGALQDYQAGINQAPTLPQISGVPIFNDPNIQFSEMGSRFTGTRLDSPSFTGSRVSMTPDFEGGRFNYDPSFTGGRFSYDPNQAMQSPDIQFLQQQGEQALMRNLASNRNLGSGSRMMDIMKFNQGLASQGLQDYFNRQMMMDQTNYGRDLGENQMAYQRALEMDRERYGRDLTENELNTARRLAAEQQNYLRDIGEYGMNLDYDRQADITNYQRGLLENQLGYDRGLTERDIGLQDFELNRQRILDNRDRSQQAALDKYALEQGAYQDRMNQLANLINVGSGAGGMTSQGALNTGQALSNIYGTLGANQAGSALGRFNAIGNTLGGLSNLYLLNQSGFFDNPYNLASTLQSQPTAGSGFGSMIKYP